ncbi:MAG: NAD(P)/FAD-dependent oxidoreductase [Candidatus Aminicenantes bacterium]|nr:NAD(P)/FAD-dependent oxidoreductase [Candidatus Aminicenantes bacterium]
MNILIAGGGLAGTMAAKALRELDPGAAVTVLDEERHRYYPRPNLIEFLAGRLPFEKVFAFPEGWAAKQGIDLRLGQTVARLRPAERTAETGSGEILSYDALLLATGARAALPPVPGTGLPGVFVLRTLDDALALAEHLRERRRTVVLGGGLLGLEIARAVRGRGGEVIVVEFFDRLLPRQLDPAAAGILKAQFERLGVAVVLGAATQEILGGADGAVRGLKLASGAEIAADGVVVAAGVRPETAVAREAGLAVGKGIVVDDRMRTSAPGVFAAGDAAEHRGRLYGIIPAAFEQARAAARAILGRDALPYAGTVPANTLKVAGLAVTSVGDFAAEGPGVEAVVRADPERGLYKKIVLRDGRAAGAIWMGTAKGAADVARLVTQGKAVGARGADLLEDTFDFSELA